MKIITIIYSGLLALFIAFAGTAAHAAGATDWGGVEQGKVRLVAGSPAPDGSFYAGVQVVLEEGWKTYWRVPGDSGVPPQFDWSRSENAGEIEVKWPAPGRFRDDYGWSNGYSKETLFPVRVTPREAGAPVKLALTFYYGVCRELCIPGKAELELVLSPEDGVSHQALISRYLMKVPRPPEKVDGLSVTNVEATASGKSVFLSVDVKRPAGGPVDLYVEGPSKYYFEMPLANQTATPDHSRFRVRVDGAETARSLKGAKLVFTAVQGDLRLEQPWALD
ncbi:MAG: protein-disulfide reductase DsbD domain-containing protein [Pseudomonadota bacterium]